MQSLCRFLGWSCIGLALLWNQWAFGGVHVWAETGSQMALFSLSWVLACLVGLGLIFGSSARAGRSRLQPAWVKHPATPFFVLYLIISGLQLIHLPPDQVYLLSPQGHAVYQGLVQAGLLPELGRIPLTMEGFATVRAWVELLSFFLFFLILLHLVQSRRSVERLAAVLLLMALFQVSYGLIQTTSSTPHIWWWEKTLSPDWLSGTYLSRNNLAGFLELTIPLCFGLGAALWPAKQADSVLRSKNRRSRSAVGFIRGLVIHRTGMSRSLLCLSLGVLLGVGLLLTGSRGGIISFTAGTMVMAGLLACKPGYRFYSGLISVLCLCVFALGIYVGVEQTAERFEQVQGVENRIDRTKTVWKMVQDYPWSGVGLGNFNDLYSSYVREVDSDNIEMVYAHNDWIQTGAELGLPGLGLAVVGYFVVLGMFLFHWFRRRDRYVICLSAGLLAGYLALGVHSFFDYNLRNPANVLAFLACLVLLHRVLHLNRNSGNGSREPVRRISLNRSAGRAAAVLGVVGFTAAVLFLSSFVLRYYQAEARCPTRINSTRPHEIKPSVEAIQKAVSLCPGNPDYRVELGKAYMRMIQGQGGYLQSIALPKAIQSLEQGLRRDPANGNGWLYLGEALAWNRSLQDKEQSVERILACFDLARTYRPRDYYVALRTGRDLLWLSHTVESKDLGRKILQRSRESLGYALQDKPGRWKEVVRIAATYQTDPSFVRTLVQDKNPDLQDKILKYYSRQAGASSP